MSDNIEQDGTSKFTDGEMLSDEQRAQLKENAESDQEPTLEIKNNLENEQLLSSVIHEYDQRREAKQEPFFSANMLETISRIPDIETRIINFEDLKTEVSTPGTMTHTIKRRRVGLDSVPPATFWSEYAFSKRHSFSHRLNYESAISFNVTCPDGYNPSIESETEKPFSDFSLKNLKNYDFDPDGVIIFSKSALEKMACYEFYNGEKFQPLDENIINEELSGFLDYILSEAHGMVKGKDFFQLLKENLDIEFQPYNETMRLTISEQNQTNLIIYAHLCLRYRPNKSELKEILSFKGFWDAEYNIKNIVEHMRRMGDYGYRFRGVVQEHNQLVYKDIDPEPEDISSIVLLNSESEQNFVAIDYKKHPPLRTKL